MAEGYNDDYQKISDDSFDSNMTTISKRIMKIMVPSVINLMLCELVLVTNIVFVGRFSNETILAGIGLANSLIVCFPITVTIGVSSVLETFVS